MARRSSIVELGSKVMTLALGDKKKGRMKSNEEPENPWTGLITDRTTRTKEHSKFKVNMLKIAVLSSW